MMHIPRALLIHTVDLYKCTGTGEWSEAVYGEPKKITRARIEPSSKMIAGKDNIQRQLSAVLFYDCLNSAPRNISFSLQDKINFHGIEYTVISIESMYGTSTTPNHFEIGLE